MDGGCAVLHTLEVPPPREAVADWLSGIDTRGAYEPSEADLAFWVMVLHYEGIDEVPRSIERAVLEHERALLSDEKTGFAYFLRWYGMVRIKGGGDRGWKRLCPDGLPRVSETTGRDWGWQLLLAETMPLYDIILILKARQIGLTFVAAHYGLWLAMFFNDNIGIVIANKMQSSKRLVRRTLDIYRHLPEYVQDMAKLVNDGIQRLEWANGSALEPMSAASDTGRSEAAGFVLIDEAAIIRPIARQEDVWASVEACADGGGKIVMFTTANGIGDMVHTWVKDSAFGEVEHVLGIDNPDGRVEVEVTFGEAEMGFVFLPYFLHPDRDRRWHEKKRRVYAGSLAKFEQEYPETWEQAFIASGLNFFDVISLEEHAAVMKPLAARDVRGSVVWEDKDKRTVKFVSDPYGSVVIHGLEDFAEALKSNRPFVGMADCAGDAPWGDYQAASFTHVGVPYADLDEEERLPDGAMVPHRQLLTIHGQMPADVYAETLVKVGLLCKGCVIAVEANGVGAAVISNMKRLRYPRMYMRSSSSFTRDTKMTDRIGWWSNADTKNNAYGLLDKYLRDGTIEIRDLETLDEMRVVVHLGGRRLGAVEPKHDDRPDGLAPTCVLASRESRNIIRNVMPEDDPILVTLAAIEEEIRAREDGDMLGNEMYAYAGR